MKRMQVICLSAGLCLSSLAGAEQQVTSYTYTPEGLIETIDGPRTDVSDVTTYTYDAAGNRATLTDALGHVTQYTDYDGAGRLLRMVDPNGLVTRFTYHPRGWLASQTVGEAPGEEATTTYDYDPAGNLIRITPPAGNYLDLTYDAANRLTDITDALGNVMHYGLDAMGNRTLEQIKDPADYIRFTLSRVYNDLNRLEQAVDGMNRSTGYGYDPQGNETALTDGNGQTTVSAFDALNRLRQVTDPADGDTTYSYDMRDNLVSVTDPNGNATLYTYDALDNQTEIDSPDSGVTTFTHDAAGNVLTRTDAKGQLFTYTYDAINRVTSVDAPGDADDVIYVYDSCTHGIGRLCQVIRGITTVDYTYTQRGQLASLTQTVDTWYGYDVGVSTLQYSYDATGRLTSLIYPSGAEVIYSYDALGQISGLDLVVDGISTPVVSNAQYMPFGPLVGASWGNGLGSGAIYNPAYQFFLGGSSHYVEYIVGTDGNGNPLALIHGVGSNWTQQDLTYDRLDRLVTADSDYGYHDYAYDAVGNRTQLIADALTTMYLYDPASNRLEGIDAATVQTDANGNTTDLRGMALEYTPDNRLKAVPDTLYATYNGLGERVLKEVPILGAYNYWRRAKVFMYGPQGRLMAEMGPEGYVTREYLYFGGKPFAVLDRAPSSNEIFLQADYDHDGSISIRDYFEWIFANTVDITGDGVVDNADYEIMNNCAISNSCVAATYERSLYYVHTDRLGTPQAMSDENGTMVWSAQYDPFGSATVNEDPDLDGKLVTLNLRFPGQYYDKETGLHYNKARYYDPETDRYLTADPIGLAGGINPYIYANANPIRYIDPNGLTGLEGTIPWSGGAAGEAAGAIGFRGLGALGPLGAIIGGLWPSELGDGTLSGQQYREGNFSGDDAGSGDGAGSEPWPGADDWRGQCIRLYEKCDTYKWGGDCGQCLLKCTAQQEWPFEDCAPWKKCLNSGCD